MVVCISSAPKNAQQGCNALEFGEVFSKLTVRPNVMEEVLLKKLRQGAEELRAAGQKNMHGGGKYAAIRAAQFRDGAQRLAILERFV